MTLTRNLHVFFLGFSLIDILARLPPELALHVLTLLSPPPLSDSERVEDGSSPSSSRNNRDVDSQEAVRSLLSCRLVSRTWCRLASDNAVWRTLFLGRWSADLWRATDASLLGRSVRATLGTSWDVDLTDIGPPKAKRVLGLSSSSPDVNIPVATAPLRVDWRILYRERLELDVRWSGATPHVPLLGHQNHANDLTRRMGGIYNLRYHYGTGRRNVEMEPARIEKTYEPSMMKISGHTDR